MSSSTTYARVGRRCPFSQFPHFPVSFPALDTTRASTPLSSRKSNETLTELPKGNKAKGNGGQTSNESDCSAVPSFSGRPLRKQRLFSHHCSWIFWPPPHPSSPVTRTHTTHALIRTHSFFPWGTRMTTAKERKKEEEIAFRNGSKTNTDTQNRGTVEVSAKSSPMKRCAVEEKEKQKKEKLSRRQSESLPAASTASSTREQAVIANGKGSRYGVQERREHSQQRTHGCQRRLQNTEKVNTQRRMIERKHCQSEEIRLAVRGETFTRDGQVSGAPSYERLLCLRFCPPAK